MTKNAKDYNDTGSVIFDDAERIRKLVFNFMKTNNPAYKEDPKYTSFATPVPDEPDHPAQTGGEESDVEDQSQRGSAKPKRTPAARESELSDRKSSVAPSAATADADGEVNADLDLTGKSFQQAQQLIISHLLHFVDSE